jgi:hypothetical protein
MEALILVATHGGPTMFARIAGIEPSPRSRIQAQGKGAALGKAQTEEG